MASEGCRLSVIRNSNVRPGFQSTRKMAKVNIISNESHMLGPGRTERIHRAAYMTCVPSAMAMSAAAGLHQQPRPERGADRLSGKGRDVVSAAHRCSRLYGIPVLLLCTIGLLRGIILVMD